VGWGFGGVGLGGGPPPPNPQSPIPNPQSPIKNFILRIISNNKNNNYNYINIIK
jgi:hypothetical protein